MCDCRGAVKSVINYFTGSNACLSRHRATHTSISVMGAADFSTSPTITPRSRKNMATKKMKIGGFVMAASIAGCFSAPAVDADEVVRRVPVADTNYCRLWFPAIREDTLFSSQPRLKDSTDGDIIFLYGPCDYDPLGSEEISRQRADAKLNRRRDSR